MRSQILFFLFLNCIGGDQLHAQSSSDKSISQMMTETETHIISIENDYYRISKVEIDQVKSSSPSYSQVKLIGGRTYHVFLLGEPGKIKDIDMKIRPQVADDVVEAKYENSLSNIIKTSYEPEKTGVYNIEIIAEEFYAGYSEGLYSLIISF